MTVGPQVVFVPNFSLSFLPKGKMYANEFSILCVCLSPYQLLNQMVDFYEIQ